MRIKSTNSIRDQGTNLCTGTNNEWGMRNDRSAASRNFLFVTGRVNGNYTATCVIEVWLTARSLLKCVFWLPCHWALCEGLSQWTSRTGCTASWTSKTKKMLVQSAIRNTFFFRCIRVQMSPCQNEQTTRIFQRFGFYLFNWLPTNQPYWSFEDIPTIRVLNSGFTFSCGCSVCSLPCLNSCLF